MESKSIVKRLPWSIKSLVYLIGIGGLFLFHLYLRDVTWYGDIQLHTLMTLSTTILAFFIGTISLLRFYTKKDRIYLFIGVGFLGSGLLDLFNAAASSVYFYNLSPHPLPYLIPWMWNSSRIFLSLMLFGGWVSYELGKKHKKGWFMSEKWIYFISYIFLLFSILFFIKYPLPSAYYPEFVVSIPGELFSGVFFLLAMIGYLYKGKWRNGHFEFWLILALVVSYMTQLVIMPFSSEIFDTMFNGAHILRAVSYVIILIGLMGSIYRVFKQGEENKEEMKKKNISLGKSKHKVEDAYMEIEREKWNVYKEKDKVDIILKGIGDAVVVIDKAGSITLFNEVASILSKVDIKDALGKNISKVLKFKSDSRIDPYIKDSISKKKLTTSLSHTNLLRKGKEMLAIAGTASPLIDGNGVLLGSVVVFRDVTKERQIDRAKSEFVSLASHQLRTPLATINWYAEMLLDGDFGDLNKEQSKYLGEMYEGSKRMSSLVRSLLDVSRLELGTFAVDPSEVDIVKLVEGVISDMSSLTKEHKVKIIKKVHDVPNLFIDERLVTIIVQNLITNAIKYTPEGGEVHILINVIGDMVGVVIEDTGYGIPAEQKDKIFTKLFRADNITDKDTEGSGLGLYIVKMIVDGLGGNIEFESKENKGTVFTVLLPKKVAKKKTGIRLSH